MRCCARRVVLDWVLTQAYRRRLASPRHLVPLVTVVGITEQAAFAQEQFDVCRGSHEREAKQVLANGVSLRFVLAPQAAQSNEVDSNFALDPATNQNATEDASLGIGRVIHEVLDLEFWPEYAGRIGQTLFRELHFLGFSFLLERLLLFFVEQLPDRVELG